MNCLSTVCQYILVTVYNLQHTDLRLVGASNWNGSSLTVYVEDTALASHARNPASLHRLHCALAEHLTVLIRHIFLSTKPPKPSQSRWTGVAGAARWALSLALFHKLLAPLMSSLSSTTCGSDGNFGFDGMMNALDQDVWVSVFCEKFQRTSNQSQLY